MNPQGVFCPNLARADRGAVGKGAVKAHSHKESRLCCLTCTKTFASPVRT
jgi:hypothetical protein